MELTSIKREILEAVLLHTKPVKATIIAKEMGKEFPATMMHLIDLTRKGFTQSPKKRTLPNYRKRQKSNWSTPTKQRDHNKNFDPSISRERIPFLCRHRKTTKHLRNRSQRFLRKN